VVETEAGLRVIVGDVRGKGLDAVQLAATVLTGFRRAAFTEASLSAAAQDLDAVVTSVAGDEDFVTAVLAEFHDDHTVTLVNCGHPPPLLVPEAASGRLVDTGAFEPPFGLGPSPDPVTFELPDHARLLFYTDGLTETRNRNGDFLPMDRRMVAALRTGSPRDALETVLDLLDDHAADDIALLMVERKDSA
jgi:serine phosphatase RsbU (regulator of sigma subunit)